MSDADWSDAKRARVEVAQRPRRIIFNDDSHDLALDDANTPEGFLGHRITPLAGTQVDTIAWSVLCGQFDAPSYDCHVQPIYGDAHGGPVKYWQKVTENVKTLAREHRCPLHLVCDFAHAHDMEAFASVRMNDVHDSFMDGNAMTVWKRTHPQFLVDTRGTLPEFELYTTAQDFSHEEVRQRKLEIIEDICQRYDVDGFELDYIRHPVLFSRRMRGEPCTPDEIEIINAFMRRIRDITDAAAQKRGRPILIATRTPDSFALCLDNGMDTQAWMAQDLIDILIPGGGYAPHSLPAEAWVAAARPHGVTVQPCINAVGVSDGHNGPMLESLRGLASGWYRAGVAGVYFWNLGTPFEFMTGDDLIEMRQRCYACLDEVGDPQTLAGKDKLFCVGSGPEGVRNYYAHVSSPWPLPLESKCGVLRTGVVGRVPLDVGDDVSSQSPMRAKLTVEFDDPSWKDALLFRLNGEELTSGEFTPASDGSTACHLDHIVSVPPLRTGRNFVEVSARNTEELPDSILTITAMCLRVEYAWWQEIP